jgi:alpha-L-rhamnosidase
VELSYADGTSETIISDENFRCSNDGIIRYSDIFIGEKQDNNYSERIEVFSKEGYDDNEWKPIIVKDYGYDNLTAQIGEPVKKNNGVKACRFNNYTKR